MRNSKMTNVFIFTAGAIIGSAVTWKLLKTKYERIAQEEIDSVKEVFSNRYESSVEDESDDEYSEDEDDLEDDKEKYNEIINPYRNEVNMDEKEANSVKKPYVISPEEFGEQDGYETVSLTYFSDKVLTDEDNVPIDDPEDIVGSDFAEHFGEYEDDSVFIRNDEMESDYEILLDLRNYFDIIKGDTEDE